MNVKCNRCGYVGDESEFPHGRDFFQNSYIRSCANSECDNMQSPGGAAMRGFGGQRPFEFVREIMEAGDSIELVSARVSEAS